MKRYERHLNKLCLKNSIEDYFENISEEKLRRDCERKAIEEYYKLEALYLNSKSNFAENYLKNNNFNECNSCVYYRCFFVEDYECGKIGIQIEEKYRHENTFIFETKQIQKYEWINVGDDLIMVPKNSLDVKNNF